MFHRATLHNVLHLGLHPTQSGGLSGAGLVSLQCFQLSTSSSSTNAPSSFSPVVTAAEDDDDVEYHSWSPSNASSGSRHFPTMGARTDDDAGTTREADGHLGRGGVKNKKRYSPFSPSSLPATTAKKKGGKMSWALSETESSEIYASESAKRHYEACTRYLSTKGGKQPNEGGATPRTSREKKKEAKTSQSEIRPSALPDVSALLQKKIDTGLLGLKVSEVKSSTTTILPSRSSSWSEDGKNHRRTEGPSIALPSVTTPAATSDSTAPDKSIDASPSHAAASAKKSM